ncbi:hypothetical protein Tcan_06465 [Toxocara canis]|uniref:Uncharacterized protein n=1 Tax=Toxocara canis TaxID=6265 RepID=A0A0B2V5F7_TOXCA|nr:hypothetical protein Tcan_06465 [Toxocara canis]
MLAPGKGTLIREVKEASLIHSQRSPNFLCPASFRSDDTPLRPITGSNVAAVYREESSLKEVGRRNDYLIFQAHLELDMRIKVPSMENKNIKVLRCAPTRSIVVGGRVVFQT